MSDAPPTSSGEGESPASTRSDIFLSYAKEDRDRARTLANALERLGWTVWWDRIIPTGREFDEVIEEELEAAKAVIVLWSSTSVRSGWVKQEADLAAQRQKLFPALIQKVRIPFAFRRFQAIDLIKWDGRTTSDNFPQLVTGREGGQRMTIDDKSRVMN